MDTRIIVRIQLAAACIVLAIGSFGCEEHFTNAGDELSDASSDSTGSVGQFYGAGVGEACSDTKPCRRGLSCDGGSCKPSGKGVLNDACLLSDECEDGLQCGFFGFCVKSAGKAEAASCTSVSDCARGLYCDLKGISGLCTKQAEKPADLGQGCKGTGDCYPGLMCSKVQGTCQPGSLPLSTDLFPGVACQIREEEELPFQARNVVPREGSDLDFYSTPFPNDVWIKDGKVDLSKHPRPGPGLLGLDLVGAVVDSLSDEMAGFSIAPTLYVRFTRPVDTKSIVPSGPKQNVFLLDLDSGDLLTYDFDFKPLRNKYICANWLALHPNWGTPLQGGRTYGLVITDDIRADLGEDADPKAKVPVQGDDLGALLGAEKPTDATLGAAWEHYAKLRAWIVGKKISPSKIIAATSFTTQKPTRIMEKFRAAVAADKEIPKIVGTPFLCGGANKGKPSPCIDPVWIAQNPGKSDPRDCPAGADSAPYYEYHVKISMPFWQKGERPYLSADGGIELDGSGLPKLQGHEDVCASIVIPRNRKMPSGGWPLLIYAHGTGGSLRSGPSDMGETVAALKDGNKELPLALLSIDQPMHGDRRGLPVDPGPLFYNFANPPAAKGNVYQGSADNMALLRFAANVNTSLSGTGTFKVDKSKIAYIGHSQGGTTGPIFLPWAVDGKGKPDMLGAVFSGTGGSLIFSLLNKKSPEDATIGIKLALQEGDLDQWHPALGLMQYYFDEADPMVYAPLYYHTPVGQPVHVLHTFGQGDSYTPPETSRVFAAATKGLMLKPTDAGEWFDPCSDLGMKLQDHKAPVSGNIDVGGQKITGVTVQHLNDASQSTNGKAYDGHFIAFKDKVARNQVASFLAGLFAGKVPTVPEK